MLTHIKKYWIGYSLLVIAIIALIAYNWDTITGWFTSDDGSLQYDVNGNPINSQGNQRARCPVGCLVETGTAGIYKCASPCNAA